MNKTFTALALGLSATVATAQSQVAIFGVLDADLAHYKLNGVSKTLVGSSGHLPSLLGLRGTEDLGGGYTAGFFLESTLLNDTGGGLGVGGAFSFNRRSTVGIATPWGEVRMGRENPVTFWNHIVFDPFNGSGPGSALNTAIGAGGNGAASANPLAFVSVGNSVSYLWGYAPNAQSYLGRGFFGHVMHALSETSAGSPPVGRYTGARVGYAQDRFHGSVAYAVSRGPGAYGAPAGLRHKEFNLGASYDFGFARLMAHGGFNETDVADTRYTHWGVGAVIPVGSSGKIPVSYRRTSRDNAAGGGAQQFAVGYVHALSKRTSVYTAISRLENRGGDTFTFRGGNGGTSGLLGGGSGTGYDIGIKHFF